MPRRRSAAWRGAVAAALLLLGAGGLRAGRGHEWPQWRGPNRDGVWAETGLIERFATPQIPIVWRAPLGSGYCGPTVAGGRVYVMDKIEGPPTQERIHCFDADTGRPLWQRAYECSYAGIQYAAGPRASITIDDGRAYALGARGHLHCLDAATGALLWSRNCFDEYQIRLPLWGIAAAPLVDEERVIVQIGGSNGACLVAFDKRTGAERWRALDDRPSYSAPIVVRQAGQPVLVCWTGDRVVGLDPATGRLHWEYPFPARMVVIAIATPVVHGDRLFLTSFYEGSLMLRLRQDRLAVERIWQRAGQNERSTDALHSIISTPVFDGDYLYGVDSYGELRCLDARTGDRIWEDQTAVPRNRWATIHFVKNGDRYWLFNERGELLIARLSPRGLEVISRAQLLKPTLAQLPDQRRGGVCWSHPAFAYGHVFARNDEELVCASLKAP